MNICRLEARERIAETIRLCLPFSDTEEGRILMEEQIYGVLIQMLTYVHVSTRNLRKEKQREGIDAAMANGVHFGRNKKFIAENYIDIYKKLENGEITKNEALSEIGSGLTTFKRMYSELKQNGLI